jgi:hypothetical protein
MDAVRSAGKGLVLQRKRGTVPVLVDPEDPSRIEIG